MRRLSTIAALLALVLAMQPPLALSQAAIAQRALGVWWKNGTPHLSFSARDLATPALSKKLTSGLPQTLLMRVYAYADRSREPVAVSVVSCRVAYDLWEEVFRVQLQTDQHDRSLVARSLAEVQEHCLVMRNHPIGTADNYSSLHGRSVYFAVSVEQNPISRDTVERIRRWLSRPTAGGSVGGDAFFGSFVSIFVNRRIGNAERVVQFRSPNRTVP